MKQGECAQQCIRQLCFRGRVLVAAQSVRLYGAAVGGSVLFAT